MKAKNLKRAIFERIFILSIVLISVSFNSGCRTIKQSNTSEIKTNVTASSSDSKSTDDQLDIKKSNETDSTNETSLITTDNGNSNETVEETSTTTKLSAPDSTGKQHPTEINTTNRTIKRGENKNLTAIAGSKSSGQSMAVSVDQSKLKANETLKNKGNEQTNSKETDKQTEEIKTPGWVYAVVIVLGGILLLVVYLILKRFNILK